MKEIVIAGLVLCALGAFVLLQGFSFGSRSNMMKVGDVQVSVQERHSVPQWAGAIIVAGGLILVGSGALGRRRS